VCLCANISKSYERPYFDDIFEENACLLGTNRLAFGEDLVSFMDPGSFPGFFASRRQGVK